VGGLQQLTELSLEGNFLRELPAELGSLASLTSLTLNGTVQTRGGITALPPTIGKLTALRVLSMRRGSLEALPPEIGGCRALERLSLSDNPLSELPEEIGDLRQLQSLDLSHTKFTGRIGDLVNCSGLRELELTGCVLTEEARYRDLLQFAEHQRLLSFGRPRLEGARRVPPRTASQARLSPEVLTALGRLGATLASPAEIPETRWEKTKGGTWPVPEAIRQLLWDVRWPSGAAYHGEQGDWALCRVRFDVGANLEEYECGYHHPYVGLAETDGGNATLLLDLSDPAPHDPTVYRLSHDAWSATDATALGSLSALLGSLSRG
jgi:hypothetical protein